MLQYKRTGPQSEETFVFLHAVGITSWMWNTVISHLPDQHCVLIDLPGHGQSNHIPWVSFDQSAKDVAAVLDTLDLPNPPHIVGLSLGSYVGLTLLMQRPDMYPSAVFSGIHIGGMPNKLMMKTISFLVAPIATRPYMARKTARMFGGAGADVEGFVAEATQTNTRAFRRASIDAVDYELPDSAANVQTPILFAAGSKEHPVILQSLDNFEQRFPHAASRIIDGVGHGWAGEDPKLFAQTVRDHASHLVSAKS